MNAVNPNFVAENKWVGAPVRVMIVDDSNIARSILSRILLRAKGIDIVYEAHDSADAICALNDHKVDIILLDIEMPVRTGIDALPELIEKSSGASVIIVSSFAEENGPAAIEALALGACDTLAKPGRTCFSGTFSKTLTEKVLHLGAVRKAESAIVLAPVKKRPDQTGSLPNCIAIGGSTGGIPAIFEIFREINIEIDCPFFITQHLPDAFMSFFARQLAAHTSKKVVVAEDNMMVQRDHVYISPGASHLMCKRVNGEVRITTSGEDKKSQYCPSVDVMLQSIAAVYGADSLSIILSGMGKDGLIGARKLAGLNARVIAQDSETSVVWGMPGAIVDENLATDVLNPAQIAAMLNQLAVR
jgi:two-component system, chemotaxis family, protein-glutamate methylesterase/glutaminase